MFYYQLHEFIDRLALTEPAIFSFDQQCLHTLKEKYSSVPSDLVLLDVDIIWIESIFAQRWQNVMDQPADYTFDSCNTNRAWIWLAKCISEKTGKSYMKVLIPSLTNDRDPDLLLKMDQISDPLHIFLSGDNNTWRAVNGIFHQLESDPRNLTTAISLSDSKLRSLTLKELWRIRSKKYSSEPTSDRPSRLWEYLINDIAPSWNSTANPSYELPASLCAAIDIYLQPESAEKEKMFNNAFNEFITHHDSLPQIEQTRLYGVLIEHDENKIFLLDILLDCLLPGADLARKLDSVAKWRQTNLVLAKKNIPASIIDYSRHVFKSFDIFQLHGLLEELPIKISPSYACKIESMQRKIVEKKIPGNEFAREFISILVLPWSKIIDTLDEDSLLVTKQYKSFWHYLINRTAPHWQQSGIFPDHLFHDLLNCIDCYFLHGTDTNFMEIFYKHLSLCISEIIACPIEDAHSFYSLKLHCKGENLCLLEALIECFQNAGGRDDKLRAIVNLIYEKNPSLVGKSAQLSSIYKYHQAGKFFNIDKLRSLLAPLEIGMSANIASNVHRLKQYVSKSNGIDQTIVKEIIKLFALVWNDFIDTPEDYLRTTGMHNKAWITLAQHLSASGLIDANYYKLLIPGLSHDYDCITLNSLPMYALPNYILSDDGSELIFLQNSVDYHRNNGVFYNCNHAEAKPFSLKERVRIEHSAQEFADYIHYAEEKAEERVVSKSTIAKVFQLVSGSVYAEGLSLGNDYNPTQMTDAKQAYKNFLTFINNLPAQERNNLNKQHILFHGKLVTFADVMEEVLNKGSCIAVWGQFFIKLVVDYDPYIKFSKNLEIRADIDAMRLCSEKKVYSDYDHISDKESQRRLLVVFASLMTHSFKYVPFTGTSLFVGDCTNRVTLTGKEIFQILESCLVANNFQDTRFFYAALMENIIKPALAGEGFITSMVRYNDTRLWLQTIEDHSIFAGGTMTFFEPSVLFTVLWSYAKKNTRLRSVIEPFLDLIVTTLTQNCKDYIKWLRINIKFAEFLNALSSSFNTQLLMTLRAITEPVEQSVFIENMTDFIIHRLSYHIASAPESYYTFFKGKHPINTIVYSTFCRLLKTSLDSQPITENIVVFDLLGIISKKASNLLGVMQLPVLNAYVEKLTGILPVLIGENHYPGNAHPVELIF